jgi:hypothetical protein
MEDGFEVRLAQHVHGTGILGQPSGAQLQLLRRFLS